MPKKLFSFGFIVALLITIADWAVIYGIKHHQLTFLHIGYFGSLLFPLLIASYWALYQLFSKAYPKTSLYFFISAAFLVAISTLIQGSTSFLEYMKLYAGQLNIDATEVFNKTFILYKAPLYILGLVLTVLESVLFIIMVLKQKSALPRWLWLFNRLFLIGICIIIGLLIPYFKEYIKLLSANISHVVFFLVLWLYQRKQVH